jgi:MSHA biogenesis protein MshP
MMLRRNTYVGRQQGSALIAALFLIVVVAALGAFAVRLQANQRQVANLQLLEYRATAAAHAGLEYWSSRVASDALVACPAPSPDRLDLNAHAGLRGFTVDVSCTRIDSGMGAVYEITADAWTSAYGSPDFVRRRLTRRVATIAPGVYD